MVRFVAVRVPARDGGKAVDFRPGTTTPHERLFAGRELEFSVVGVFPPSGLAKRITAPLK